MKKTSRNAFVSAINLDIPEGARKLHVRFQPQFLDLSGASGEAELRLTMPKEAGVDAVFLAVDAYQLECPVHPEGHFGWWLFDIKADEEYGFVLKAQDGRLSVYGTNLSTFDHWVNDDAIAQGLGGTILLHLVLRHRINNSILSQQSLVAYRDATFLERDAELAVKYFAPCDEPRQEFVHGFNCPKGITIHVLAQGLPRPRQISGLPCAVMAARRLTRNGIPCRLYASSFDPRLRRCVRSSREVLDAVKDQDIVMLFYDNYEENLSWLSQLQCRKAFLYLGVPSTRHLQAFDAEAHKLYTLATRQIGAAKNFNVVAAASPLLAKELSSHLTKHALGAKGAAAASPEDHRTKVRESVPRADECHNAGPLPEAPYAEAANPPSAPTRSLLPANDVRGTSAGKSPFAHVDVLTASLLDRPGFWREIPTAQGGEYLHPLLVCPAPLEPCNDFLATLEVFEKIVELRPQASLVAASTRARHVYFQYMEYMLATRFQGIRRQVHLKTNLEDENIKDLLQRCDALIQLGRLPRECVEDAKIFGKCLFTNGAVNGERLDLEHAFRLYGSPEEQAEAVLGVLDRQRHVVITDMDVHMAATKVPLPREGLWEVVERLVALPLKSGLL